MGTEGSHILTALLSPLQLVLPADIHGPLCPHDYHLRRGPGENEVRPKLPGAHCRPGATHDLPHRHHDLRDCGLCPGVDHLCPVPDDPSVLLIGAGHVSGHIGNGQQGHIEAVTGADKTGRLVRSVDVDTACHRLGLVGHHPHRPAVHADKSGDHIGGIHGLGLKKLVPIRDLPDNILDIVGLFQVIRNEGVEHLTAAVRRVAAGHDGRHLPAVWGQVAQQGLDLLNAVPVVRTEKVRHA